MRTFPQLSPFIILGLRIFCCLVSSKTSKYQFSLKWTFLPYLSVMVLPMARSNFLLVSKLRNIDYCLTSLHFQYVHSIY